MTDLHTRIAEVLETDAPEVAPENEPRLVKRKCGGWLALSNDSMSLKIGVTGISERAARLKFAASLRDWKRTLESDVKLAIRVRPD